MLTAAAHRGNTKGTTWPVEPLANSEVEELINQCSPVAATGLRNRALIVVLWKGMLRVSEALQLKPADIDLATGTIRVLKGKGKRARTVAIGPTACAVLGQWLTARQTHAQPQGRLFCTLRGTPVTPQYARLLLPRLAAKAGIAKRCHPHALRHSGACHLRRSGVDIAVISRALGHSNLATTSRYLNHLAPTDVIDALRALAW